MFDPHPITASVSLASSGVSTHIAASEIIGSICFILALSHTFFAVKFKPISHYLSETELAFPFWGIIFLATVPLFSVLGWIDGSDSRNQFMELAGHLDFSEPALLFVILLVTNTPLVMRFASRAIDGVADLVMQMASASRGEASYITSMIVGPLMGSLITEPAAMTVTALFLRDRFFNRRVSRRFKFMSFANLLVNVSIGGALTNFAAPPILMVRDAWGWSSNFVFFHFGLNAALAIVVNTGLCWFFLRGELRAVQGFPKESLNDANGLILKKDSASTTRTSQAAEQRAVRSLGSRLFYLVNQFEFRSSLYVALFLAGVVVLGHQQAWWLRELVEGKSPFSLFLGSTVLTSVTDNAALTYLSTQIESLTPLMRHAVVAGSIAGGGISVVANAPNPIGFSILREQLGDAGFGFSDLLRYALLPTAIAMICLWSF